MLPSFTFSTVPLQTWWECEFSASLKAVDEPPVDLKTTTVIHLFNDLIFCTAYYDSRSQLHHFGCSLPFSSIKPIHTRV